MKDKQQVWPFKLIMFCLLQLTRMPVHIGTDAANTLFWESGNWGTTVQLYAHLYPLAYY